MTSNNRPIVAVLQSSTLYNPLEIRLLAKIESILVELNPDITFKKISIDVKDNIVEGGIKELEGVDVLIGSQFIFSRDYLLAFIKNIKWLHVYTAGVENIVNSLHKQGIKVPGFQLTRNAGHFDKQMVEYAIGWILMMERHFLKFYENQKLSKWIRAIEMRSLNELTLGIVGFGTIGRKLAKMAFNFKMKIIALTNQEKDIRDDSFQTDPDSEFAYTKDIKVLLSSCDYVCNLLPSSPATDGFFDNDILQHCQNKKTVFINIGRANVIKEASVIKALDCGWIGHAVLDVFEIEPLPETSELWKREDVTITPHHAGFYFDHKLFAKDFRENYDKFCLGQTMANLVDWDKGY